MQSQSSRWAEEAGGGDVRRTCTFSRSGTRSQQPYGLFQVTASSATVLADVLGSHQQLQGLLSGFQALFSVPDTSGFFMSNQLQVFGWCVRTSHHQPSLAATWLLALCRGGTWDRGSVKLHCEGQRGARVSVKHIMCPISVSLHTPCQE